MPSRCILFLPALAFVAVLAAPSTQARAEGFMDKIIPPVKIDAGFKAWFKIYTPQKMHMKNLAPWYTYFPYDPRLMAPPQASVYPTWPQPFPPVAPQGPAAPGQDRKMPPADSNLGWAPATPQAAPTPPGPLAGPQLQPVSYYGGSFLGVPGYWYGR